MTVLDIIYKMDNNMKLDLKNIGIIHKASIEINGITIIAGENNTGKSTVGHSLFTIFNAFSNIEKQNQKEKYQIIEVKIQNFLINLIYKVKNINISEDSKHITEKILQKSKCLQNKDIDEIRYNIKNIFIDYFQNTALTIDEFNSILDESLNNSFCMDIKTIFDISTLDFTTIYVHNFINNEFSNQIENVYSKGGVSEINLTIKNNNIGFSIDNETNRLNIKNNNNLSLEHQAFYIDDPFILDLLNKNDLTINLIGHRYHLFKKLYKLKNKNTINTYNEIIVKDKLKDIYSKLFKVVDGDIFFDKKGYLVFKKNNTDETLHIQNLSAGFKTFAIIKLLLENSLIQENGTIILDEPEVHLNPKWQILFAELIVLLQKKLNLHILLNTHSPYFLQAIHVYSKIYGIKSKCKYYLTKMKNNTFSISDVSNDISQI